VVYNSAGTFDVTLLVSNANGTSSKTIQDYITVNAFVPSYCASYGNSTREWISQVVVNGITNNSGTSGVNGYVDYTGSGPAFQVNPGATSSITLKPAYSSKTSNAEYFAVWIDLNNDKDFSDAGELVVTATKIKASVTRTFVVPSGTAPCVTRMRVSMKRNALPSPCEIIANGEVEDYKVNIGTTSAPKKAVVSNTERDIIRIYPNPVHNSLTLELNELYPGDQYLLFSVQGILIRKDLLEMNVTTLNTADLSPGIYLMEIRNGKNRHIEKIIRN
jgi:PKD repeat protein